MLRKRWLSLGALALLGGVTQAQDKAAPLVLPPSPPAKMALQVDTPAKPAPPPVLQGQPSPTNPDGAIQSESGGAPVGGVPPEDAPAASEEGGYGPTPLGDVKILQNLIFGDNKKPCINISGWADFDYTYRSTGSGINNVAPVMNRFGDEALIRQLGIYLSKPLDPKTWSWGFNAILIAGSDAAFLNPTAGWFKSDDPRFGVSFTDLNLTAHLPILTEGGVDVKAGRQTTILGPMGTLPWQRYFDSSDYAWYNEEEGYTGVSAVWHISKRLDWYNGAEIGGWGSFFDATVTGTDYITNISYWLDEEAKKTKIWMTVLTGPTGHVTRNENTTVVEVGLQENWTTRIYQIIDSQMVYSKAPVFGPALPPGYQERAYDVYTYLGAHLTKTVDINSRFEWYKDVDGGGYAGGFGVPKTDYFEVTLGPDYHPTKCVQFRPEIRYDYATHDNFGPLNDKKNQLSLAAEVLFKF